LKPDPAIFRHATEKFRFLAEEAAFFDDIEANVEGARSVGMEARIFTSPGRCEADLQALGLSF
jgi:HAD superfamily hydrolase (TIGR01509 family)